MKRIKIKFVDFGEGFRYGGELEGTLLYKALTENFDICECDDPDYIIFDATSSGGCTFLNYDCIRIAYTAEHMVADFNLADYAISEHGIGSCSRNYRIPYYLWAERWEKNYKKATEKHLFNEQILKEKKFCNYIYSNDIVADPLRKKLFDAVNSYKRVDAGGICENNIGYLVQDKIEFQSHYKFSIAAENSVSYGNITEKIVDAFAAKTIPIYLGAPDISLEFNPKSFINCHDYNNFDDLMKKVIEIDEDDDKYIEMLREPIHDISFAKRKEDVYAGLVEFLSSIFLQDVQDAYRRSRYGMGKLLEKQARVNAKFDNLLYHSNFTKLIRKSSKIKAIVKKIYYK